MRIGFLNSKGSKMNTARFGVLGAVALLLALGAQVACSDDDAGGGTPDAGTPLGDGGVDANVCPPLPPLDCTAKKCTEQLGEPATCVKNACVKLKSPECPTVVGPSDDDSALVFGAVHDLFGGQKGPGQAGLNAQELAVREINDKGGVRDPDRCKPARPLVMVGCNDSNFNPDTSPVPADAGPVRQIAVVEHLAGELGVPIITGGTTSGTTLAINNYMQPKYPRLYLTTRSTSPVLENPTTFPASQEGTRLFWRSTGNAKGQTVAMRLVLAQIAEAAKARYTILNVKVALMVKNDAFGVGTADAFEQGLTVNGAPAGGANVNANYMRINYRERAGAPGTGAMTTEQDASVTLLRAFAPEIIIFISTDEFVAGTANLTAPENTGILKPYEDYVRATAGVRKPFYLHSHASISNAFTKYLTNIANFSDAAGRLDFLERTRGTNLSEPTLLSSAFFSRYKSVFPVPAEIIYGMPEAYDATYIAAYLYAGAIGRKAPFTPIELAKSFPSLVEGGNTVDNGPTAFNAAVQTLTTGGKINYNGAVSPFDWNYTTGEAPYNANVWCVQYNQTTSTPFYQQNAGQIWRYTNGQLEGNYNCPQN